MKLWNSLSPVTKAILEHMVRGGIAALAAAYAGGTLTMPLDGRSLGMAAGLFAGGMLASLLLSLGVSVATGTGPALNKAESFETRASVRRRKAHRSRRGHR